MVEHLNVHAAWQLLSNRFQYSTLNHTTSNESNLRLLHCSQLIIRMSREDAKRLLPPLRHVVTW